MSRLTDFVNATVARDAFLRCGNSRFSGKGWKLSIGNGHDGCVCEILLNDLGAESSIPDTFGEFEIKEDSKSLIIEILEPKVTIESRNFEVVFFKHI